MPTRQAARDPRLAGVLGHPRSGGGRCAIRRSHGARRHRGRRCVGRTALRRPSGRWRLRRAGRAGRDPRRWGLRGPRPRASALSRLGTRPAGLPARCPERAARPRPHPRRRCRPKPRRSGVGRRTEPPPRGRLRHLAGISARTRHGTAGRHRACGQHRADRRGRSLHLRPRLAGRRGWRVLPPRGARPRGCLRVGSEGRTAVRADAGGGRAFAGRTPPRRQPPVRAGRRGPAGLPTQHGNGTLRARRSADGADRAGNRAGRRHRRHAHVGCGWQRLGRLRPERPRTPPPRRGGEPAGCGRRWRMPVRPSSSRRRRGGRVLPGRRARRGLADGRRRVGDVEHRPRKRRLGASARRHAAVRRADGRRGEPRRPPRLRRHPSGGRADLRPGRRRTRGGPPRRCAARGGSRPRKVLRPGRIGAGLPDHGDPSRADELLGPAVQAEGHRTQSGRRCDPRSHPELLPLGGRLAGSGGRHGGGQQDVRSGAWRVHRLEQRARTRVGRLLLRLRRRRGGRTENEQQLLLGGRVRRGGRSGPGRGVGDGQRRAAEPRGDVRSERDREQRRRRPVAERVPDPLPLGRCGRRPRRRRARQVRGGTARRPRGVERQDHRRHRAVEPRHPLLRRLRLRLDRRRVRHHEQLLSRRARRCRRGRARTGQPDRPRRHRRSLRHRALRRPAVRGRQRRGPRPRVRSERRPSRGRRLRSAGRQRQHERHGLRRRPVPPAGLLRRQGLRLPGRRRAGTGPRLRSGRRQPGRVWHRPRARRLPRGRLRRQEGLRLRERREPRRRSRLRAGRGRPDGADGHRLRRRQAVRARRRQGVRLPSGRRTGAGVRLRSGQGERGRIGNRLRRMVLRAGP